MLMLTALLHAMQMETVARLVHAPVMDPEDKRLDPQCGPLTSLPASHPILVHASENLLVNMLLSVS